MSDTEELETLSELNLIGVAVTDVIFMREDAF
jgi:hypothetical protein